MSGIVALGGQKRPHVLVGPRPVPLPPIQLHQEKMGGGGLGGLSGQAADHSFQHFDCFAPLGLLGQAGQQQRLGSAVVESRGHGQVLVD